MICEMPQGNALSIWQCIKTATRENRHGVIICSYGTILVIDGCISCHYGLDFMSCIIFGLLWNIE